MQSRLFPNGDNKTMVACGSWYVFEPDLELFRETILPQYVDNQYGVSIDMENPYIKDVDYWHGKGYGDPYIHLFNMNAKYETYNSYGATTGHYYVSCTCKPDSKELQAVEAAHQAFLKQHHFVEGYLM